MQALRPYLGEGRAFFYFLIAVFAQHKNSPGFAVILPE
jgi:hypothetical protein